MSTVVNSSDESFPQLVEQGSDGVLLSNSEGIIQYASSSLTRKLGYKPEEWIGSPVTTLVHEDDRSRTHPRFLEMAAAPGSTTNEVFRLKHKDGSWRWFDGKAINRLHEPGVGVVVMNLRDVTEEKFRDLADSLPQTIFEMDLAGNISFVNHAGYAMWGVDEADVRNGINVLDWLLPQEREAATTNIKRVLQGERSGNEYMARKKDGTVFPIVVHSRAMIWNGQPVGLRGMVVDITKQKASEQARERSESRFRSLVKNAVFGIYRSTLDGRFVEVNPAFVQMMGYSSEEELLNVPVLSLYEDPRDRRTLLERFRFAQHVQGVEAEWKRKDGSRIVVRLNGRWVSDDGHPEGFEMIVENVSERRKLEDQLHQAQKMEAVGRLAGGIAHDFNNLLTAILGYADLLLEQFDNDDPRRQDAEEITKAAHRAESLTRQLLAFSRKQVLQSKPIALDLIVSAIEPMLRRLIGEDVHLAINGSLELGFVKADPGQIEQVIMNLAVNARDAMPEGGTLTIETSNVTFDAEYSRQHESVLPGEYVMLAVTDTGCGMTEEVKQHIFEPFFTTKERGKGTGLGLATVYGIIRQSGGHVWVYSEPGRGTTFKIYFPKIEDAESLEGASVEQPLAEVARGTETILLVEDEQSVRALARELLRRHGYVVLEAQSGEHALKLAEEHRDDINLLVTDVVMPKMSGRELADRVTAMRPDMNVLYISGYPDSAIVANGELRSGVAFLQKPFARHALINAVRDVLDGTPGTTPDVE